VASIVLLSSLIALVYVWRVVEVAYFQDPPADRAPIAEAPLSMLIPLWTLIGALLFFGVNSSFNVGVARRAALQLLGVEG
jgi:multicomponent Na+:H+ antiporter subunit D